MTRGTGGQLPDELALIPPGPQLATILASADMSTLDDTDLVRYTQARQRQLAHDNAQLLSALHELGRRGDQVIGGDRDQRWAEAEIAFAMTWTPNAAGIQLAFADDLVERLPVVFAALERGDIDQPKAWVMSDLTTSLDARVAREVIEKVIDEAPRLTTGQLRARLAKLVFAADPDAKAKRVKKALAGRRVQVRPTDDGLAELYGYDLPPHRAAAAMERLTALARAAKRGGDARTVSQLRADAMLDLLAGEGIATGGPITDCPLADPTTPPNPAAPAKPAASGGHAAPAGQSPPPTPASTGPASQPSEAANTGSPTADTGESATDTDTPAADAGAPTVAGFGPVVADIARHVVADNPDLTWRYSVYDQTGLLMSHGITRRRPTAPDAAFIKARDRTCRAPGCRMPSHRCEIDHTEAWAKSHNTSRPNLSTLCTLHHHFKHLPGTDLVQLDDGILAWKTPLGQCVVTQPPTYFDNY